MRCGALCLWWCVLVLQLWLHGCGGDRFAPSTLREYLREVVTEALDKHYAELNQRLDRLEKTIQRYGEAGGSCGAQQRFGSAPDRVVVCNFASWTFYRPGNGKFTLDDIDTRFCTHLLYQYVGLDERNSQIISLNPTLDRGTLAGASGGYYSRFAQLKRTKPGLKAIVSIGGYVEGSKKYSDMARDPAKRAVFVKSAVDFLKRHGFDGLDVNWHHPGRRGGIPDDRQNFVLLLQELRAAFVPNGWLLTATLSPLKSVVDVSYDVPRLNAVLDLLLVQAFDYHGIWDRQTGHNAPLGRVSTSLSYYLQLGADPAKLVLGIPLSGNSFLLVDPAHNGVGAPTGETAFQGPYTLQDGHIGYNEMCEMRLAGAGRWTMRWDDDAKMPYFVQGSRWASVEDERSVVHKVALVRQFRLAGVMVISLDMDDFRGICGEKNKLMRAITQALRN